ncbi:MAG: DNA recombination protein RmuC [Planctomycetes bacterium]|jgi:DNA recombination protein RmuC|nr:DNA recombination protein RmuC [Planctomycetota bacterium]
MEFLIGLLIGAAVGSIATIIVIRLLGRKIEEVFRASAAAALDANSQRIAQISATQLDGKKALIDQSLDQMNQRLESVRQLIGQVEAQRKEDMGGLSVSVKSLAATTGDLHKMLASSQRRGAWGERMAEDVLRLAGLQEHINYLKQSSADAINGRADFTFLLPNGLKANMDVKFPLEKYKAWLDAPDEPARAVLARELCQAVRGHIKAVAGRGYIDPNAPTVPYVIVFIPSDQILGLVLECQPDLIDDALKLRVVLCGPLTLYAKLAIMRQAAESFNLAKTADEVLAHLQEFRKQWSLYSEELAKLGQRMDAAVKQFELVQTTRTNMLQRPLDKIESLTRNSLCAQDDSAAKSQ